MCLDAYIIVHKSDDNLSTQTMKFPHIPSGGTTGYPKNALLLSPILSHFARIFVPPKIIFSCAPTQKAGWSYQKEKTKTKTDFFVILHALDEWSPVFIDELLYYHDSQLLELCVFQKDHSSVHFLAKLS